MARYKTMYERLVANTRLAEPDNPHSCWLWTGHIDRSGYARIAIRTSKGPRNRQAARVMLEELYDIEFPFDEAGHLCDNPMCISPMHLEVQTKWFNLSLRPGYAAPNGDHPLIPTLFPRNDRLAAAAEAAWEGKGTTGGACPF